MANEENSQNQGSKNGNIESRLASSEKNAWPRGVSPEEFIREYPERLNLISELIAYYQTWPNYIFQLVNNLDLTAEGEKLEKVEELLNKGEFDKYLRNTRKNIKNSGKCSDQLHDVYIKIRDIRKIMKYEADMPEESGKGAYLRDLARKMIQDGNGKS